ncbi:MAG: serine O-acetyltransferase [Clostridia bacterium]|nr:serine O-acetyltransferase [Clostridia bacterium]
MDLKYEAAKLYKETARELYNLANTVEKQGRKAAKLAHCTARKAAAEIKEDINTVRERDPAAESDLEVLLLYSGFHAVLAHRAAHALHKEGYTLSARAISQIAKFVTGVEIHPAAKIGRRLFIDHGCGVVIGETAEIGDDCTIYQGATLGGTGKDTGKRHPTLGNNVMVGAGAKVLGPFTVGDNAKIAANAVVLHAVPANSTAVGIPAKVVSVNNKRVPDLDQIHIPDPVMQEICRLEHRIFELEKKISETEDHGKDE